MPYATILAHRKSRALVKLVDSLALKEHFFADNRNGNEREEEEEDKGDEEDETGPKSLVSVQYFDSLWIFSTSLGHEDGGVRFGGFFMFIRLEIGTLPLRP